MQKKRRNAFDKFSTLLFGKDLRITEGEPYKEVRDFDFSSYYPEDKYIKNQDAPVENVFDIRDFGADINNEDNAPFINSAIDAAGKTGGTVMISGGDFVCSTVTLKSGVTLFICKDSSISANETGVGYEDKKVLVYAENAENITLTGGGKLKGNGNLFGRKPLYDKNVTEPYPYIDVIDMRREYRSQLRFAHPSKYGGVIEFNKCKNITVDNFIIENSAHWTFKITNSSDLIIKNFIIHNNRNVANADGIDISGTSNIDISHCFISTADDGIVLKNAIWLKSSGAMKNINIDDCEIISRTNAVKIGTETTYDISDVTISNSSLFMTDLYPGSVSGISIEACDGSVVSRINIHDIKMNRCTCPLFIRLGNRNRAAEVNEQSANAIEFAEKGKGNAAAGRKMFDGKSEVKDIIVKNVTAQNVELPIIIAGYKQKGKIKRVQNVLLENIDVEYADIPETVDKRFFIPEYAKVYPECWRFRNLPAYFLWVRHAENIKLKNVNCRHSRETWKKEKIFIDVK